MMTENSSAPLVSVILVVYNAEATLRQAIESVARQSYVNCELVVIDGKSTDGSVGIIQSFKQEIAYFVSEKDAGVYDAMNKGIAAAKGEWIYFLGADDIFYDEHVLDKIFISANISGAGFIYGNTKLLSGNGVIGGSRTYRQLIDANISHQAIFYHKNIFRTLGVYDLRYKVLADYDLNLRIFRDQSISKQYLDINVCIFNDKGGLSNTTIDHNFFSDKLSYFIREEKMPPRDPLLQQYNFYTGISLLFGKKNLKGLSYCLRAFTSGRKKIFYILVFVKFALSFAGLGKKIKITG
jgi:glycosyltransferase involved in cell wall biosynthesis